MDWLTILDEEFGRRGPCTKSNIVYIEFLWIYERFCITFDKCLARDLDNFLQVFGERDLRYKRI